MKQILLVEDEIILGKLIKESLEKREFDVSLAKDANEALAFVKKRQPNICILDVMLPGMDGYTLAKQLKSLNKKIPILFLTARSQTKDVIKGYESGGNDYLKKPFSFDELILRVNELLNRYTNQEENKENYKIGIYSFNPAIQSLEAEGISYKLTFKESELLKELILNKNSIVERHTFLTKFWGEDNYFNTRNMDVYIVKLRKYLKDDTNVQIINVRGMGYKLADANFLEDY
jgi:two-component system response regulator TrcR